MKNKIRWKRKLICLVLCLSLMADTKVYAAGLNDVVDNFHLAAVASGFNGIKMKVETLLQGVPDSAYLQVDEIMQLPELPTGCETTALTMVLNYHGFSVDKTTIADDYLVKATDDYPVGFSGDPYSYDGAGIWPPGLAKTAKNYLQEQNTLLWAHDLSGKSLEDLYSYVAKGYPVILWVTIDYSDPTFTGYTYEYSGKTYEWFGNEHCVVLAGYSKLDHTVTLLDPEQGEIVEDSDLVSDIMEQIGNLAIGIY